MRSSYPFPHPHKWGPQFLSSSIMATWYPCPGPILSPYTHTFVYLTLGWVPSPALTISGPKACSPPFFCIPRLSPILSLFSPIGGWPMNKWASLGSNMYLRRVCIEIVMTGGLATAPSPPCSPFCRSVRSLDGITRGSALFGGRSRAVGEGFEGYWGWGLF